MNQNVPTPSCNRTALHHNGTPPSHRSSIQQQHSLDIAQRFERKLAQYNASQNVFKRWLFEIVSWIASAASMSAIVGILLYCRDQPLNQRPVALAAYNVLSKVTSAALILPVSEAIGQLKWAWFYGSESKDIYDFEVFDKASRGAWGSFLLLFRTKGRSLAALGAVLTLLLLATDTFFQQVTDYPDRWALEEVSSTIASVIHYAPTYRSTYWQGWEDNMYDMDTRQSVAPFMYGNGTRAVQSGNSTRPEIPLSCPASNCTWPIYDTLAVCSQCVQMDAPVLLSYACMNTTIDWSAHAADPLKPDWSGRVCGYFLNATSDKPTLMSGYIVDNGTKPGNSPEEVLLVRNLPLTELYTKQSLYGGSINFKDQRNTILDFLTVSASNDSQSVYSSQVPIMHECALTWCVKSLRSSYVWGSYKEEVTAIFQNTTSGPWPWTSFEVAEAEGGGSFVTYMENPTIEMSVPINTLDNATASTLSYGASNWTACGVMSNFDDWFPSSYTTMNSSAKRVLRYKNYMYGPRTTELDFYPWLAPNNISAHVGKLAAALTNGMRSNMESIALVPGSAYNRKQFIVVRWEWLTFPLTLLMLSLGFLLTTVVRTSKDAQGNLNVWKTSAMPTLIYSLPKHVQQNIKSAESSCEQTRKVMVRLHPREGWRVSGQQHYPSLQEGRSNHQPPPGWI